MKDADFLSDNEEDENESFYSSDSDGSFKQELNPNSFKDIYKNKQIETLKHLRQTLKENKILKKRLHLIENEARQYQEFQSFYPLKECDKNSEKSAKSSRSDSELDLLPTTEDKECQVDLIESNIIKDNLEIPIVQNSNEFLKEHIQKEEKLIKKDQKEKKEEEQESNTNLKNQIKIEEIKPEIVMVNKLCQTHEITEKKIIESLEKQLEEIKTEKDSQIDKLNGVNLDLSLRIESLNEKLEGSIKSYEIITDQLNESHRVNIRLSDENRQIDVLKNKIDLIQMEHDLISHENSKKDSQLSAKNLEIDSLKETIKILNENFKTIDRQKEQIEYLLAENEKHLKEKHVICQQKISELTSECQSNIEFIQVQSNEIQKQNNTINELNLQIEKMKMDQQNFNFKEFVTIKRELNALKQEKERLFANKVTQPNSTVSVIQPPLPPIKEKKNLFNFFGKAENN